MLRAHYARAVIYVSDLISARHAALKRYQKQLTRPKSRRDDNRGERPRSRVIRFRFVLKTRKVLVRVRNNIALYYTARARARLHYNNAQEGCAIVRPSVVDGDRDVSTFVEFPADELTRTLAFYRIIARISYDRRTFFFLFYFYINFFVHRMTLNGFSRGQRRKKSIVKIRPRHRNKCVGAWEDSYGRGTRDNVSIPSQRYSVETPIQ